MKTLWNYQRNSEENTLFHYLITRPDSEHRQLKSLIMYKKYQESAYNHKNEMKEILSATGLAHMFNN